MIAACGLAEEVIEPEPAANRRYIYRGGRLRELRRSPLAFARSGLLGPLGLARLAMEPLAPARPGGDDRLGARTWSSSSPAPTVRARSGGDDRLGAGVLTSGDATPHTDESLFDFAARRMGRQAAARLISPVVLGIFAGDARRLSAAAAFPRLVAMEQAHGSLFKAMRAGRKRGVPPPGHRTFRRGIEALPRAAAALPGIDVACNRRVTAIEHRGGGFAVTSSAGGLAADAVVVAADLPSAADLVDGVSSAAAEELRQIESPPIAVVHTAFEVAAAAHIEPAYGFLVARGEGIRMLGCQYETATFSGRSPEDRFLTRSMYGGSVDRAPPNLTTTH